MLIRTIGGYGLSIQPHSRIAIAENIVTSPVIDLLAGVVAGFFAAAVNVQKRGREGRTI
jgi:hypothetical protein